MGWNAEQRDAHPMQTLWRGVFPDLESLCVPL